MTLQHLKYILTVAEKGSISEAARELHISQPSLSNAIKEVEKELCFPVFTRNCLGIALTKEGVEFTGYARQVMQEMDILEDHFVHNRPRKKRFCVSTQHYTFTANAFVEDMRKTKEAGMNEHLTKPVDGEKLLQVLYKYKKTGL